LNSIFIKIDVKSRWIAGLSNMIWGFETTSIKIEMLLCEKQKGHSI